MVPLTALIGHPETASVLYDVCSSYTQLCLNDSTWRLFALTQRFLHNLFDFSFTKHLTENKSDSHM
jgi:hypothetical protein